MKHRHVDATLTSGERIAPWAAPGQPQDGIPLTRPTRTALVWQGLDWTEIDPETGEVLATGSMRG